MKMKSMLQSNHDLKKNGYIIIRKLHKLEKKKNCWKAYNAVCEEGYFWILSCKNLAQLILSEYSAYNDKKFIEKFLSRTDSFLKYLDCVAYRKGRISKKKLSLYLKQYTKFFNRIQNLEIPFIESNEILVQWNRKCVMAYIAAWGIKG